MFYLPFERLNGLDFGFFEYENVDFCTTQP